MKILVFKLERELSNIKSLPHWPWLARVCSILVSSQVFCPCPFHRSQTSHRRLHTEAASVHIGECRERRRKGRTASGCLSHPLLSSPPGQKRPLYEPGRTCAPGVWCGWCSSQPGGQSRSPPCRQNQKGTRIQGRRASSRLSLRERQGEREMMIKQKRWEWTWNHLPEFTCVYVGLAEQQRQTLHPVKGVEVVDTLVKAVHAILVLETWTRRTSVSRRYTTFIHVRVCVCVCVSPAAGQWGWWSGWGSSCWRRWRRCWTPGCAGPESAGVACGPPSCYTPLSQNPHHQLEEGQQTPLFALIWEKFEFRVCIFFLNQLKTWMWQSRHHKHKWLITYLINNHKQCVFND